MSGVVLSRENIPSAIVMESGSSVKLNFAFLHGWNIYLASVSPAGSSVRHNSAFEQLKNMYGAFCRHAGSVVKLSLAFMQRLNILSPLVMFPSASQLPLASYTRYAYFDCPNMTR